MTSPFLQKAEIGVKSAKVLPDLGDTDGACSRAYYAMYDAARATLDWAGVAPAHGAFKTHHGVIAAFSLHLVKPGLFPAEPGRAIQRAQSVRQVASQNRIGERRRPDASATDDCRRVMRADVAEDRSFGREVAPASVGVGSAESK